ncbi:MAG: Thymidylate kinase [Promethearchaeota archaeon]|nr:MAG: Thymidylate kinase [Candidatus Lokiarchaeota archaeon]
MVRRTYRNKGSKDNIVFSISGAHGVGKSTIFHLLKNQTETNHKFKFFPERYVKKPPFPLGSRNKEIAFRSEIHFLQQLIKRNKNVWTYDNRYNGRIIILDRTPLCVLVYSKALFLKEKDFQLILDTYNSVKWREDKIIYLSATPEEIIKRTIKRGSLEKERRLWNETEKNYLDNVLLFYKKMLFTEENKGKIIHIDTTNLPPYQVLEQVKAYVEDISGYSFTQKLTDQRLYEEKSDETQQTRINRFL